MFHARRSSVTCFMTVIYDGYSSEITSQGQYVTALHCLKLLMFLLPGTTTEFE